MRSARSAGAPRKSSPNTGPSRAHPRQSSPNAAPPAVFSRKNSPSTPQTVDFGPFFVRWANFFALTPTSRPSRANFFAHRTQPRADFETNNTSAATDAGQRETAITNATEKRIKNAHFSPAKATAVSSEARPARAKATAVSRERFVMPVGYGGAWTSDQRAADVTNVVKPTQFKSPHEDPCYKRRQSKPKNHHFQRKSPRIDDVCNNNVEIHTKNSSD